MTLLENFKRYELDNEETIRKRIASQLKTVPEYLIFPRGFNIKDRDFEVESLQGIIQSAIDKDTDIQKFIEEEKLTEGKIPLSEIIQLWMSYDKATQDLAGSYGASNFISVEGVPPEEIDELWKSYPNFIQSLKSRIQVNDLNVKEQEKLYREFDKVPKGAKHTDFIIESIVYEIEMDNNNQTLSEIFNSIILTEAIPFASFKSYYKILKDFIPRREWATTEEDTILLKMFSKENIIPDKYDDYQTVSLQLKENKISIVFFIRNDPGFLSKEETLKRIFSVFSIFSDEKKYETYEKELVGAFYYYKRNMNTHVMADLIMNDKLFSSVFDIDEHTSVTKRKGFWQHLYFTHPNIGEVIIDLAPKLVNRADKSLRSISEKKMPHNSPYIEVKIKKIVRKNLDKFIEFLSRFLVLYEEKEGNIISEYRTFLPTFAEETRKKFPPLKESRGLDPKVFLAGYPSKCAHPPRVVDKSEHIFPRDVPEDGKQYPSDGVNQMYYECDDEKFKYFGVRENTLKNKDEYPFLPCCYRTDQTQKRGAYRTYYLGDAGRRKSSRKQQGFIKTDKILSNDNYGKLPEELNSLFEGLEKNLEYSYIRLGVDRTPSSFLQCVMRGLYEQTNFLKLKTSKSRKQRIEQIRQELASENIVPLSRQCNYDRDLNTIIENVKNTNEYLDPKRYIQLLEGYFRCRIFLFSRTGLILPKHKEGYYMKQYENDEPYLLIYEHTGSKGEYTQYPQCELIVRWKTKTEQATKDVFSAKDIGGTIRKIFKYVVAFYSLNREIQFNSLPVDRMNVFEQFVDAYGKTRIINIEHKGARVSLYTSPMAPISVQETSKTTPYFSNPKEIADIFREYGGKILSMTVQDDSVEEINGIIGSVYVSIPCTSKGNLNIPISPHSKHYNNNAHSELSKYNRNKKIARYLTEYTLWIFSKILHARKLKKSETVITDKLLNAFGERYMKIDKKFHYKNISKTFTFRNSGLTDNRKRIIVNSLETRKRLIYLLKLYSIRNLPGLENYHKKKVIENYYDDLTDFDSYPNQVILYGDGVINKWIAESSIEYTLYSTVQDVKEIPYFFRNKLVSSQMFVAQNTYTLQKALDICQRWQYDDLNIGPESINIDLISFTLYSYTSKDNIVAYVFGDQDKAKMIHVLGYRVQGEPRYTSLLPLYKE